jgi:hypothetical protein
MSEIEAYCAGLLDADGSISVRNTDYSPQVMICNNRKAIIDWLLEHFGGKIYEVQPNFWHWKPSSIPAFLDRIEPYLVGKREQAQIARATYGRNPSRRKVTQEEWAERKQNYLRIIELNTGHLRHD